MLKNFLHSFISRLNWQINCGTLLEVMLLFAVFPLMQLADAKWFVENGIIENLQLIVLLFAIIIAMRAQTQRRLFVFAALVISFMLLREVNFGRAYLCLYYGIANEQCSWSVVKYSKLIKTLRLLFAIGIGCYFIKHKLYINVWQFIQQAPVFVWDIVFFVFAVICSSIAEFPCIDNEIFEESCELLSYVALTNLIWRYSRILPEMNSN